MYGSSQLDFGILDLPIKRHRSVTYSPSYPPIHPYTVTGLAGVDPMRTLILGMVGVVRWRPFLSDPRVLSRRPPHPRATEAASVVVIPLPRTVAAS